MNAKLELENLCDPGFSKNNSDASGSVKNLKWNSTRS